MKRKHLMFVLTILCGAGAQAATLHVENTGTDDAACGITTSCRSISQAIQNAAAGDTILVGPGRYGDVNLDGRFDDPGDERAQLDLFAGPVCIVCITKPVTIASTHGASLTVIDAGNPILPDYWDRGMYYTVVNILSSNVTFGVEHGGFSLGAWNAADGVTFSGDNISIEGNISSFLADGFIGDGGNIRVSRNASSANEFHGFSVAAANLTFEKNVAMVNLDAGVSLFQSPDVESPVVRATSNVSSANMRDGFEVVPPSANLTENIAVGNLGSGFAGSGTFTGSHALANQGPGFTILGQALITLSNIFANDEGRNCGIVNRSGTTVAAGNNYWGRRAGPGPNRADAAGPGTVCDVSGATTVSPPAGVAFPIL